MFLSRRSFSEQRRLRSLLYPARDAPRTPRGAVVRLSRPRGDSGDRRCRTAAPLSLRRGDLLSQRPAAAPRGGSRPSPRVVAAAKGVLWGRAGPRAGPALSSPPRPAPPRRAPPAAAVPSAARRQLPAAVAPARGARGRAGRKRKAARGGRQDGGGAAVAAAAAERRQRGPEPGRGVALSPAGSHEKRRVKGPAVPLSGPAASLPPRSPPSLHRPPEAERARAWARGRRGGPRPGLHHVGHPSAGEGLHPQRGSAMGRPGHGARLLHLRGAAEGDVSAGARRVGR